jgi:hypothetical protein
MSEPEPGHFTRLNVMEYTLAHRASMARISFTVGVAAMACVCVASTAETGQGYVLTAYSDAVGGNQLLAGQYSAALIRIRTSGSGTTSTEVVKTTNACVAYIMLRRLREAGTSCDAAVSAATMDRSHAKGVVTRSRIQEDSAVAIAFSNRAIARALSKEAVSSAEDLVEAHYLAPQSDYVVRNIAAFKQSSGNSIQPAIATRRIDD